MVVIKKDELFHIGMPRRSGRYPWGSGENPYQRMADWRANVLSLKKDGMSEKEIAQMYDILDNKGEGNIQKLRDYITIAKSGENLENIYQAKRLLEDGYTSGKIAEIMGRNESTVREWLNPLREEKAKILQTTVDMLKTEIDKKGMLDVSDGVELHIGVKRPLLDAAITDLESQGYLRHNVPTQQVTTGKPTWTTVLTKEDVDYQTVRQNESKIKTVTDWTEDGGETFQRLQPVKSISSERVMVRFKEDGGEDMDGMIQLRPGVPDLNLGDKHYAQVRVAVDGTHFMKGMAVYSKDMPDGIDVIYNSNKSSAGGKQKAFKSIEKDGDPNDPTNPFKTTIRQQTYLDKDGNEQLSLLNKVGYSTKIEAGEAGYWDSWHSGKALASQFLSKQNIDVAKTQLNRNLDIQRDKYNDIQMVNNPAVKQRLLDSFSDDCDSKAVKMEGAALPRQSSKVILGIPSLKDNEVYSPSYKNGEELILVRYPHAGTFEIPRVRVNNKNAEGQFMLGNDSVDAIGISPKTAARLSGADFDGDSVIAIPYSSKLKVSPSLEGLKDFNPKIYKYSEDITNNPSFRDPKSPIHKMTDYEKGMVMGGVSNLITDMTIKGAPPDHIARAVRHSMVAIDAQKHDLDYKASERENNIRELKTIYQGGPKRGAATLISRATSDAYRDMTRPLKKGEPGYETSVRRGDYSIDIATGRKVYGRVDPKAPYTNKDGKLIVPKPRQKTSTQMYETEDANTLLSKEATPIERVYADYANSMKQLANQSRRESALIKPIKMSPSAKAAYKTEVDSLMSKLNLAKMNRPLERGAQRLAKEIIEAKKAANPNLTASQLRKISGQAIAEARLRVGAGKLSIQITEKEWNAIQAGAISNNTLQQILNNTKIEDVQKLATPRTSNSIPPTKIARAKSMLQSGYTLDEIAETLNISASIISTF